MKHMAENVQEAMMDLRVIRADGTIEDGPVLYYHKNPLKRLLWRLRYGKEGQRYPKGVTNGNSSNEPRQEQDNR
jgi:hypothetical protein